jgi:hypothetical protein
MDTHTRNLALSLERTEEGWALVSSTGTTVYEATGPDARRDCLREARARGVTRLAHWAIPRFPGALTGLLP